MRIAFTTDYFWPHVGGGVEKVVFEVSRRLARLGHEVSVVTLDGGGHDAHAVVEGVQVHRTKALDLRRPTGLTMVLPRRVGFLRRLRDADVVNVHNPYFGTSMLAGLSTRKPLVTTLHVAGFEVAGGTLSRAVRVYDHVLSRRLLARSRRVICVSEDLVERARGLGASPSRVRLIRNGVDLDAFSPDGTARDDSVLFVGRMTRNKGPDVMLAAAPAILAAHPRARIDFVGDGPMRRGLEREAGQTGLAGHVRFHGQVEDVRPYLHRAAVYVRPSLTDGMPLTVLEALASGTPVVASDVGGTREILDDTVHAKLVPAGDAGAVATAVGHVMDGRAGRRQARARGVVEHWPSWDDVASRYLGVFEEAVAEVAK